MKIFNRKILQTKIAQIKRKQIATESKKKSQITNDTH